MEKALDDLRAALSSARPSDLTPEALVNMRNLQGIRADPASETNYSDLIESLRKTDAKDLNTDVLGKLVQNLKPAFLPPKVLPCANVQECQHAHWVHHKGDCKSYLRSTDWKPEQPATFLSAMHNQDDSDWMSERLSFSVPLWGNVPATDILNLQGNEGDGNRDFSLAFAASGDMRHVIATVNALPEHYSGNLAILLNDRAPWIVSRNICILLILTRIPDLSIAVDIALHFWYSVFIPSEYRLQYITLISTWIYELTSGPTRDHPTTGLVNKCSASFYVSQEVFKACRQYVTETLDVEKVQAEYNRVRFAPSRQQYRDAMYSGLRPSHRVAFHQYRRFGIILPHGAIHAHFNYANPSLFTPNGEWFQTDYADPIEGWNMDNVIEAGKRHGASPEDIYGCFYFMATEQLRIFAERLRKFRISFKICSMDALDIPRLILSNELSWMGMPPTLKFDRIHVSNIMDINYLGINGVLSAWAPLLSNSHHAAILGYFMNWSRSLPGGSLTSADSDQTIPALLQMIRDGKILSLKSRDIPTNKLAMMQLILSLPPQTMTEVDAHLDTSKPFNQYLSQQKFEHALRKSGLKRREKHQIVPQRILAPIDGPSCALPVFPSEDSYYYNVHLTSHTWTEIFVEIVRANV